MLYGSPKAKGNNRSLKSEQKLVSDKTLERNIQIEISREFVNNNKKNSETKNKKKQ